MLKIHLGYPVENIIEKNKFLDGKQINKVIILNYEWEQVGLMKHLTLFTVCWFHSSKSNTVLLSQCGTMYNPWLQ